MKPLHTSELSTASDSRMVVRVGEISTPDGPVRRIVVEANAEMDTTEARWLRDKLDLAITLVEGEDQSSTTVARGQAWLHRTGDPTRTLTVVRVDKPLIAGRDDMTFVALRTVSGKPKRMLVSQLRAYYRPADLPVPAVSEDQPKPRVWHRGDAPGPLRYSVVNVARLVVTEEFAATTFVMRKLGMSFAAAEAALSCLETWGVVRPTTGSKSRDVADIPVEQLGDLVAELNQVLADSEQVRHG